MGITFTNFITEKTGLRNPWKSPAVYRQALSEYCCISGTNQHIAISQIQSAVSYRQVGRSHVLEVDVFVEIMQFISYTLPGSVVGITTGYGLEGPGSNPGVSEIFRTCPERPWGPLSLLYIGYRVFPGGKIGWGVTLTPHPLLVPWSWKSRAIPLFTLWAVRPVQILSACTRMYFLNHKRSSKQSSFNLLRLKNCKISSTPTRKDLLKVQQAR
jgi:hypothetical protein